MPGSVSVVIPCFNQAHFLADSIGSVLEQTRAALEILVVDDGSTDDTAEVAERFAGVRCIRQRNHGVSAARNAGLRASNGEFVVFLDADDRLLPHALQTGLERFAARPEFGFVAGRQRSITADGSPLQDLYPPCVQRDHYRHLLERNYFPHPAVVMYRRAALVEVGGFDPVVNAAADYASYLRIARDHPVDFHPDVVAEYRQHSTSMSRNSALMLRTVLAVLRAERPHLRNTELRRAYRTGVRTWRMLYGTRLAHDVRVRVRSGSGGIDLIWDIGLLLRHDPMEFARHLVRKLRGVLRRRREDLSA